jgi:tetratricopeptide (TPR) repeat protein
MSRPKPEKTRQIIERLLREAEVAWGEQEYGKSIALIEQACRKEPTEPSLYLALARAHGQRYDFPTAERWLEKSVQVSQTRAQTLSDAGHTCLEFEHVDMAIKFLQRAAEKNGAPIGALMTLADILIRDNRLDDAAELVSRASQIDRKDPRVLLEESAIIRQRGRVDEAESLLRTILAKSDVIVKVRVRALYDLASILDRSGRYDEAMTCLLEAKAIQRAHAAPYAASLAHIQNRAKEMEQTISASVLERWRSEGERLQPQYRIALLCGHPRSGTTLLEQVLDSHDDIVSAEETKIMHDEAYLPLIKHLPEGTSVLQALDGTPPSLLNHGRENYFRCTERFIEKQIGNRLLLDKNPGLNVMIPMVVRVFPETKFIVALRDPRDVIVSCFQQALPLTPISSAYLSIEGTVKQYASVLGFWLEMRPRLGDRWLQVRYEEMIDDLPAVARSTLGFLGVGFDDKVLQFHQHAQKKRVKSPSHADVTRPVYRTAKGRWRNYQKYLEPYLAGLDRFLKEFGYG